MTVLLLERVITSLYWVPTHTRYWYIPGSLYKVTHVKMEQPLEGYTQFHREGIKVQKG